MTLAFGTAFREQFGTPNFRLPAGQSVEWFQTRDHDLSRESLSFDRAIQILTLQSPFTLAGIPEFFPTE
jgi:hypothetical protein